MELNIYFNIIRQHQLLLFLILCITIPNVTFAQSNDSNQTSHHQKASSQYYSGNFIKKLQVNKVGKKLKTYDYFFLVDKTKKEYFIKFNKKTISIENVEQHIIYSDTVNNISKPLSIKGIVKQGLLDTDDPKQQSRIGEYILIYQIIKK